MRILAVHNFYQQAGGEDLVFSDETGLLEKHGHAVDRLTVSNDAVDGMAATLVGKLRLAAATVWNRRAARMIADRVRAHHADVVHFHNTFPLVSPAAYAAARSAGAAVVQTIHNFRFLCAAATFYRDGAPCEKCLGRFPIPAVIHSCYRGSRSATAVAAASMSVHRMLRTYRRHVDAYISLTDFGNQKFIEANFPADRLYVKPNFVDPDPGIGDGQGNFALYVGRLTPEKGIATMLAAWKQAGVMIPLKICGDGPMAGGVQAAAAENNAIMWLGRQPMAKVMELVGQATCLVFPSTWYEGQGRTILEAFARGTPVLASDLGTMRYTVEEGRTGLHFASGDAASLAAAVKSLLADQPRLRDMRHAARIEFETRYSAETNYSRLLEIYRAALNRRHRHAGAEMPAAGDKMATCP